MNNKQLVVFAGPNGSGKSTIKALAGKYELPFVYINADDIARALKLDDLPAAQETERQREAALASGISFAFETVLSTDRNLLLIRKAKAIGYEIRLFYILTQDPEINVFRVQSRVSNGGHDVPPDTIRKRYP